MRILTYLYVLPLLSLFSSELLAQEQYSSSEARQAINQNNELIGIPNNEQKFSLKEYKIYAVPTDQKLDSNIHRSLAEGMESCEGCMELLLEPSQLESSHLEPAIGQIETESIERFEPRYNLQQKQLQPFSESDLKKLYYIDPRYKQETPLVDPPKPKPRMPTTTPDVFCEKFPELC